MHPSNGIDAAEAFVYDGIPMAFYKRRSKEILALAARFAPLLRIFPERPLDERFEIDWDFYAASCDEYRGLMNLVLLAAGVFTLEPDENLRIALARDETALLPRIKGKELFFPKSRLEDAKKFIERAEKIFARKEEKLFSWDMAIIQCFLEGRFDKNRPGSNVTITT
jgi:hypothetical protein